MTVMCLTIRHAANERSLAVSTVGILLFRYRSYIPARIAAPNRG